MGLERIALSAGLTDLVTSFVILALDVLLILVWILISTHPDLISVA